MTQEFINRFFGAMMGKCWHKPTWGKVVCPICGGHSLRNWFYVPDKDNPWQYRLDSYVNWSPSLDGEATKEVRDWFTKELPEQWEKYCDWIVNYKVDFLTYRYKKAEVLNAQLSITNLAQYIVDNYKEMFFDECTLCSGAGKISENAIRWGVSEIDCPMCLSTGYIVKPEFAEAVRVIQTMLKDEFKEGLEGD
jgi:hypothetical protein